MELVGESRPFELEGHKVSSHYEPRSPIVLPSFYSDIVEAVKGKTYVDCGSKVCPRVFVTSVATD